MIDRLCLGTAQFGMPYGIANKTGRPSKNAVFDIMEYAYNAGIGIIDTASEYGDSESIIGEYFSIRKADFKIIAKMPAVKGDFTIEDDFRAGLKRLRQPRIYGYLVRSAALSEYRKIQEHLERLKEKHLIEKIGLSLYKTDDLDRLLDSKQPFDIIQVPYNIFDRRFDRYFSLLKGMGIEIYTRSVFLQGLFFLGEDRISESFTAASAAMTGLRRLSAEKSISVSALCLCFAALNGSIDKIVIGVDSPEQIKENIESLRSIDKVKNHYDELKALKLEDEEILLPYNWI